MTKQSRDLQDYIDLKNKLAKLEEEMFIFNVEREKRASDLVIANKELKYQNEEKDKRAAELLIANKELVYQNSEKENRAAELLIANKELVIQNIEKENRLAEIVCLKDAQLFVEKQLFEKTLISIGDGVISSDHKHNILFMNKIAENLTGWTKEIAIGKPIYSVFNIVSKYNRRNDEDIISKVIDTKTIHNLANHTILITKDGQEHLIEDSAAPILNKDNNVIGVVVVFRDYTEKWERLKEIEYLNFHDDLTGLYNRRFFEEELKRLDVPRNLPLSIVMGDLNGLKLVNDSFGHFVGDELLQKTAISIREGCREDEIAVRLGGDEFAIILPNCSEIQASSVIRRIKDNLAKKLVNNLKLSISFGIGCKTTPEKDIHEVLRESEDTMYKHKLYESSSMRSGTIELISKTLFEKNQNELTHSNRVSELAEKLSERIGFDSDKQSLVKLI